MIAIAHGNQLHGESHAIARPTQAALQHSGHVQRAPDLGQRVLLTAKREGRRAGGHMQPVDLDQCIENVVGDPVGKVLIVRICTQVLERQNRQRLCRSRERCRAGLPLVQRGEEKCRGIVPVHLHPREHLLHRARHRTRHAFAQRRHIGRCLHESFRNHRLYRRPGERRLADQHLVQHAAQTVQIAGPSTSSPTACSGLMYDGVPTLMPICVSVSPGASLMAFPMPKSATSTWPSCSRMFSGLISR